METESVQTDKYILSSTPSFSNELSRSTIQKYLKTCSLPFKYYFFERYQIHPIKWHFYSLQRASPTTVRRLGYGASIWEFRKWWGVGVWGVGLESCLWSQAPWLVGHCSNITIDTCGQHRGAGIKANFPLNWNSTLPVPRFPGAKRYGWKRRKRVRGGRGGGEELE